MSFSLQAKKVLKAYDQDQRLKAWIKKALIFGRSLINMKNITERHWLFLICTSITAVLLTLIYPENLLRYQTYVTNFGKILKKTSMVTRKQ